MTKPQSKNPQSSTPTPALDDDGNTVAIPRPANELDGDKSTIQPGHESPVIPRGQ